MSKIGGSKMNEIDIENLTGRELDAAVAEAMGNKVEWLDKIILDPWHPEDLNGNPAYSTFEQPEPFVVVDESEGNYDFVLTYSSDNFPLVKREIEHRGWRWTCECRCVPLPPLSLFWFEVRIPTNDGNYGEVYRSPAKTEEIAGCRAFLMACETGEGKEKKDD